MLILPVLSGCGTYAGRMMRTAESDLPRFGPAMYFDGSMVAASFRRDNDLTVTKRVAILGAGLVDLPISLITDILFLPLDIWDYPAAYRAEIRRQKNLTLEQRREIRDAHIREQEKSNHAAQSTAPKVADPGR